MSRIPEASFCSSAPAASGSPHPSSSFVRGLLYWVVVCVLAWVGWAASVHVQVAHAREVSWSVGVNVPGSVVYVHAPPPVIHTQPPVRVYREPEPVYRPPVVVHRSPAYIVSTPVTAMPHPRWDERHPRYQRYQRHHTDGHHGHQGHHGHHGYRHESPRYPDPYAYRPPHQRGDW
jgi:hypothetical protein